MTTPAIHPLIRAYLTTLEMRQGSPATLRAVRADVIQFACWWEQRFERPFDPAIVRERDVRLWQQARQQDDGTKPATINRARSSLRSFFSWLIAQQVCQEHPVLNVPEVTETPLAPRALPPGAIDALFRALDQDPNRGVRLRNEALLALLAYAGLREQEACQVQLRDLDLAAGVVLVRAGKRGSSRRVPLHAEAQRALQRYLQEVRCPDGLPPMGSDAERGLLLGRFTRKGQPASLVPGLTPKAVYKIVRTLGQRGAELLREAATHDALPARAAQLTTTAQRLDQISPHQLRHSLARRLLTKGVPLPEVQRILGHTRLSTTGMYLTPSEDDLRDAIDKVGW